MCRAREAIATTSFVGERDSEKGFDGNEIVIGFHVASLAGCMCSVESQEADITSPCSLLKTTDFTPCACVLRTVCDADGTSILRKCQLSMSLQGSR